MSKEIAEVMVENPKQHAFKLYMENRLTNKQIASTVGISIDVFNKWRTDEGWVEKRRLYEEEINNCYLEKYQRFIVSKRGGTAQQHLAVHEKFLKKVWSKLNQDNLSTLDLRNLGQALKSAADVGARAVGITDKPDAASGVNQTFVSGNAVIVNGLAPRPVNTPKKKEEPPSPAIPPECPFD